MKTILLYVGIALIHLIALRGHSQTELIINGDFTSTNSGWAKSGSFQYDSRFSVYHNSIGYAYLTDINGQKADNISGTLSQDFFVPSSAKGLTVSYWYRITSDETTATSYKDICIVTLVDPSNAVNNIILDTLSNLDKNTAYSKAVYSISPIHTGKNWRLMFSGTTNSTLPTVFRIDDVSVLTIPAINTSCVNWANGIKPNAMVDSAMSVLCSNNIIANSQTASSLSNPISRLEIAKYIGKVLLGNSEPTFMDYFPNIFPDLQKLSQTDQRYIKLMLYLEYKSKLSPLTGNDDVSPFSREFFYINFSTPIKRSDAIKALLEAWNITPLMLYFDATSNTTSPLVCDVAVSNKNLGWIQQAKSIGLLYGILTTTCGSGTLAFGNDANISYAEFYVLLARMSNVSRPNIGYDDFFVPNLFYINNLNNGASLEKGVFNEYADNGFTIPSGGIGLSFQHTYHSNLTEIPFLNNDNDVENLFLKPKLQPIGGGWTHNYLMFIKSLDNNGNKPERILVYWPDGTIHSFLVSQNKYETQGITDKLTIDSYNTVNQPSQVTITRGRNVFTFKNIDIASYSVLSITSISDSYNNSLNFEYTDGVANISGFQPKLLSKVTDSYSGRSLSFSYFSNSNYLKSVTDPLGRILSFNVNVFNSDLDSYTDAKNQTTKYWYKEEVGSFAYRTHLLVQIQKPKGNYIKNIYFSRKLSQTQSQNYLINIVAVPDYRTQWSQQTSEVSKSQNNQTLKSSYVFDANGNILNNTTSTDSIGRVYNTDNRVIVERDFNLGFITKYSYDNNGYVNKVVVLDSLYNDSTKYEYSNNIYGEATSIKDYNDQLQPIRQTNIYRNTQGSPTSVVINEGLGGEIRYSYGYDSNGLLNSYTPPSHNPNYIYYNSYGNVNKILNYPYPSGTSYLSETFDYDKASRTIAHTDKLGVITTYDYDANDNLTSVIKDADGLNLNTQYSYDQNDNIISIKSPKGLITTLGYDYYTDDLIEENDGINKKKWRYNDDGSLDSFINKNNNAFKYLYYNETSNPNNQLNGLLYSDGRNYYQYWDKTKALHHINNTKAQGNKIWYDSRLRGKWNKPSLISTEGFFSGVNDNVYYEYDRLGKPTLVSYPNLGNKDYNFSYRYDFTTQKLAAVENTSTNKLYASYTYANDGKPLSEIYGNGDTIFYHYDSFNRADSIWAKNKNNQLLYFIGVALDNSGKHIHENLQIIYKGQPVLSIPTLNDGQTKSYSFENTRNRIVSGDSVSYTNDGAGNIVSSSNPSTSYTWSDFGQLINISKNGVQTIYDYDPLGFRRRKNNTYYVVDQQNTENVLFEATQTGTPISAFIYGNGLVARIDPIKDSVFYYHNDFRGSVIAITNQNGDIVQYYKYEPFGKVYDSGGYLTWNNPYQYIGKWGVQTDDSDVYYMKARYYQPSTGRFISEDPIWNTNLFVYAGNDPVNNIDHSGKKFDNINPINSIVNLFCLSAEYRYLIKNERLDNDEKLNFCEARTIYKFGDGETNYVNINNLNTSGLNPNKIAKQNGRINFDGSNFNGVTNGLVYGTIKIEQKDGNITSNSDTYNFDIKKPWKGNFIRNIATLSGRIINGDGKGFKIKFYGKKKIY